MAAGPRLDAAGQAKMKTLDEALLLLQRVNGLAEQYALAVKGNRPASPYMQNIRRTLPTLAENLKSQFGMISDVVVAMLLASSRAGGGDQTKVRTMREFIASIRQQLEIAEKQILEKHAVHHDKHDASDEAASAEPAAD